jgi:hypothetical protein
VVSLLRPRDESVPATPPARARRERSLAVDEAISEEIEAMP